MQRLTKSYRRRQIDTHRARISNNSALASTLATEDYERRSIASGFVESGHLRLADGERHQLVDCQ
jgi:hypothetical protein